MGQRQDIIVLTKAFSFDRIKQIQVVMASSYVALADKILVHPSPDWTYPDVVLSLEMKGEDLWWRALDYQVNHRDEYPPVEIQVIRNDAPQITITDGTLTHLFERTAEVIGKMSCREFKDLLTGEVITEEQIHSDTCRLREERIIRERIERLVRVEKKQPFLTRFRNLLED